MLDHVPCATRTPSPIGRPTNSVSIGRLRILNKAESTLRTITAEERPGPRRV